MIERPERILRTLCPGRLSFRDGLQLQQDLLEKRRQGSAEVLVLLEHAPVITMGRASRPEHLLCSTAELASRGIDCLPVSRGGDVTFHGPGQLVGYPILSLDLVNRDLHRYLRCLETVLIDTLTAFDLPASRHPLYTGVWVNGRKIASIGVAVRHWVSWHGFALNINTDLDDFAAIVPCGLPDIRMTSMAQQLGGPVATTPVSEQLIRSFATTFDLQHAGVYDVPPNSQA
jgi:lipoate-protein ligase B